MTDTLRFTISQLLQKACFHGTIDPADYDGSPLHLRRLQHTFLISSATEHVLSPASTKIQLPSVDSRLHATHICDSAAFLGYATADAAIYRCEGHLNPDQLQQLKQRITATPTASQAPNNIEASQALLAEIDAISHHAIFYHGDQSSHTFEISPGYGPVLNNDLQFRTGARGTDPTVICSNYLHAEGLKYICRGHVAVERIRELFAILHRCPPSTPPAPQDLCHPLLDHLAADPAALSPLLQHLLSPPPLSLLLMPGAEFRYRVSPGNLPDPSLASGRPLTRVIFPEVPAQSAAKTLRFQLHFPTELMIHRLDLTLKFAEGPSRATSVPFSVTLHYPFFDNPPGPLVCQTSSSSSFSSLSSSSSSLSTTSSSIAQLSSLSSFAAPTSLPATAGQQVFPFELPADTNLLAKELHLDVPASRLGLTLTHAAPQSPGLIEVSIRALVSELATDPLQRTIQCGAPQLATDPRWLTVLLQAIRSDHLATAADALQVLLETVHRWLATAESSASTASFVAALPSLLETLLRQLDVAWLLDALLYHPNSRMQWLSASVLSSVMAIWVSSPLSTAAKSALLSPSGEQFLQGWTAAVAKAVEKILETPPDPEPLDRFFQLLLRAAELPTLTGVLFGQLFQLISHCGRALQTHLNPMYAKLRHILRPASARLLFSPTDYPSSLATALPEFSSLDFNRLNFLSEFAPVSATDLPFTTPSPPLFVTTRDRSLIRTLVQLSTAGSAPTAAPELISTQCFSVSPPLQTPINYTITVDAFASSLVLVLHHQNLPSINTYLSVSYESPSHEGTTRLHAGKLVAPAEAGHPYRLIVRVRDWIAKIHVTLTAMGLDQTLSHRPKYILTCQMVGTTGQGAATREGEHAALQQKRHLLFSQLQEAQTSLLTVLDEIPYLTLPESEYVRLQQAYAACHRLHAEYTAFDCFVQELARAPAPPPSVSEGGFLLRLAETSLQVLLKMLLFRNASFYEQPALSADAMQQIFAAFCLAAPGQLSDLVITLFATLLREAPAARTDLQSLPVNLIVAHQDHLDKFLLQSILECCQSEPQVSLFRSNQLGLLIADNLIAAHSPQDSYPFILSALEYILFIAQESVIHKWSRCALCAMSPIYGARYRNVRKANTDLCTDCFGYVNELALHPAPATPATAPFTMAAKRLVDDVFIEIPRLLPLASHDAAATPPGPIAPLLVYPQLLTAPTAAITHPGVTCDGCGEYPIAGIRYKCTSCDNFDYCGRCYQDIVHLGSDGPSARPKHFPHHLFLVINRPIPWSTFQTALPSPTNMPAALLSFTLHPSLYPVAPAPALQPSIAASSTSGRQSLQRSADSLPLSAPTDSLLVSPSSSSEQLLPVLVRVIDAAMDNPLPAASSLLMGSCLSVLYCLGLLHHPALVADTFCTSATFQHVLVRATTAEKLTQDHLISFVEKFVDPKVFKAGTSRASSRYPHLEQTCANTAQGLFALILPLIEPALPPTSLLFYLRLLLAVKCSHSSSSSSSAAAAVAACPASSTSCSEASPKESPATATSLEASLHPLPNHSNHDNAKPAATPGLNPTHLPNRRSWRRSSAPAQTTTSASPAEIAFEAFMMPTDLLCQILLHVPISDAISLQVWSIALNLTQHTEPRQSVSLVTLALQRILTALTIHQGFLSSSLLDLIRRYLAQDPYFAAQVIISACFSLESSHCGPLFGQVVAQVKSAIDQAPESQSLEATCDFFPMALGFFSRCLLPPLPEAYLLAKFSANAPTTGYQFHAAESAEVAVMWVEVILTLLRRYTVTEGLTVIAIGAFLVQLLTWLDFHARITANLMNILSQPHLSPIYIDLQSALVNLVLHFLSGHSDEFRAFLTEQSIAILKQRIHIDKSSSPLIGFIATTLPLLPTACEQHLLDFFIAGTQPLSQASTCASVHAKIAGIHLSTDTSKNVLGLLTPNTVVPSNQMPVVRPGATEANPALVISFQESVHLQYMLLEFHAPNTTTIDLPKSLSFSVAAADHSTEFLAAIVQVKQTATASPRCTLLIFFATPFSCRTLSVRFSGADTAAYHIASLDCFGSVLSQRSLSRVVCTPISTSTLLRQANKEIWETLHRLVTQSSASSVDRRHLFRAPAFLQHLLDSCASPFAERVVSIIQSLAFRDPPIFQSVMDACAQLPFTLACNILEGLRSEDPQLDASIETHITTLFLKSTAGGFDRSYHALRVCFLYYAVRPHLAMEFSPAFLELLFTRASLPARPPGLEFIAELYGFYGAQHPEACEPLLQRFIAQYETTPEDHILTLIARLAVCHETSVQQFLSSSFFDASVAKFLQLLHTEPSDASSRAQLCSLYEFLVRLCASPALQSAIGSRLIHVIFQGLEGLLAKIPAPALLFFLQSLSNGNPDTQRTLAHQLLTMMNSQHEQLLSFAEEILGLSDFFQARFFPAHGESLLLKYTKPQLTKLPLASVSTEISKIFLPSGLDFSPESQILTKTGSSLSSQTAFLPSISAIQHYVFDIKMKSVSRGWFGFGFDTEKRERNWRTVASGAPFFAVSQGLSRYLRVTSLEGKKMLYHTLAVGDKLRLTFDRDQALVKFFINSKLHYTRAFPTLLEQPHLYPFVTLRNPNDSVELSLSTEATPSVLLMEHHSIGRFHPITFAEAPLEPWPPALTYSDAIYCAKTELFLSQLQDLLPNAFALSPAPVWSPVIRLYADPLKTTVPTGDWSQTSSFANRPQNLFYSVSEQPTSPPSPPSIASPVSSSSSATATHHSLPPPSPSPHHVIVGQIAHHFATDADIVAKAEVFFAKLIQDDTDVSFLRWIRRLKVQLTMPGFSYYFASVHACRRQTLAVILGSVQVLPTDPGKLMKPLDAALQHYLGQESGDLMPDAAILTVLLQELAELSATMPVKPERFQDEVAEILSRRRQSALAKSSSKGSYWASGTGYGTSSDASSNWSQETYQKEQSEKADQMASILKTLIAFLARRADKFSPETVALVSDSCMVPFLASYLRNDSIQDMTRFARLWSMILQLITTLVSYESMVPLFAEGHQDSLATLASKLTLISDDLIASTEKLKDIAQAEATPSPNEDDEDEACLQLAKLVSLAGQKVAQAVLRHNLLTGGAQASAQSDGTALSPGQLYDQIMRPLQFGEGSISSPTAAHCHHYQSQFTGSRISRAKLRRLTRELATLKNNMPLHLESSVFLRVDSQRPDVLQVLITGPILTPYSGGCFLFDIFCPETYPTAPPLVNLETTGNGSVRFNPNLYNSGKVCLSLLGTWSGAQAEKWNESTSTLLQVFVSIQSLIFVPEPFFNEPGYERQMGSKTGQQRSRSYNSNIRQATIRWAHLDQLRNPPAGFEEVINNHFRLRGQAILAEVQTWCVDEENFNLRELYAELASELEARFGINASSSSASSSSLPGLTWSNLPPHFKFALNSFFDFQCSNCTVALSDLAPRQWHNVAVLNACPKVTFRIDCTMKGSIMFGVSDEDDLVDFVGSNPHSIGFLCKNGTIWHDGVRTPLSPPCLTGGTFSISLNQDHQLTFSINNTPFEITCFKPKTLNPFVFISLIDHSDQITLLQGESDGVAKGGVSWE